MLTRLAFAALLLLPAFTLADQMNGTVIKLRRPSDKDDGVLIVKTDVVGKDKYKKPKRFVYERAFVFGKHLAEGKHLPGADKEYLRSYPNLPGEIKEGDEVQVEYRVIDKKIVVRGIKRYEVPPKKDKDKKDKK